MPERPATCLAVRLNDLVDDVATEHEWQIVARVVTLGQVRASVTRLSESTR